MLPAQLLLSLGLEIFAIYKKTRDEMVAANPAAGAELPDGLALIALLEGDSVALTARAKEMRTKWGG